MSDSEDPLGDLNLDSFDSDEDSLGTGDLKHKVLPYNAGTEITFVPVGGFGKSNKDSKSSNVPTSNTYANFTAYNNAKRLVNGYMRMANMDNLNISKVILLYITPPLLEFNLYENGDFDIEYDHIKIAL